MAATEATEATEEKIKKVLESLENGSTVTAACKSANLCRATFYFWAKKETNSDTVDKARDGAISVVEDALYISAVKKFNVSAQIFFLKNRAPNRWRDRVDTEVIFEDVSENRDQRDKEIKAFSDTLSAKYKEENK